jgi:hypothetical protein
MLTRREVLIQLKRMGAEKPSSLKAYLKDFENYMAVNYGLIVVKTKKTKNTCRRSPLSFEKKQTHQQERAGH